MTVPTTNVEADDPPGWTVMRLVRTADRALADLRGSLVVSIPVPVT